MRPNVTRFAVPVRSAAPQAIAIARGLGRLYGRAINGQSNGAVRYGYPALGTRAKFTGYAFPPQLFVGYDPRKVAAGSVRVETNSLPGLSSISTVPDSPLSRAMATVTLAQGMRSPGGGL